MALKEGDNIVFCTPKGRREYTVNANHLSYSGDTNAIVFHNLGLNPEQFCARCYGYPTKHGQWPQSEDGDFAALDRCVKALQEECKRQSSDVFTVTMGADFAWSSADSMRVTNEYYKAQFIQPKKTIMSDIITFAKNLVLSADEKLLREQDLKDSCGEYTNEAWTVLKLKLLKDNEPYLIEIATAKKAADESKK